MRLRKNRTHAISLRTLTLATYRHFSTRESRAHFSGRTLQITMQHNPSELFVLLYSVNGGRIHLKSLQPPPFNMRFEQQQQQRQRESSNRRTCEISRSSYEIEHVNRCRKSDLFTLSVLLGMCAGAPGHASERASKSTLIYFPLNLGFRARTK